MLPRVIVSPVTMSDEAVDRRELIKLAGGTVTAAAFAGCAGDDDEETEGDGATPPGESDLVEFDGFSVPSDNVAPAEELTDDQAIHELSLIVNPPKTTPSDYNAMKEVAKEVAKLGIDISVETMDWPSQVEEVWYGEDWDMTFWEMVGRPSRLDPDEFLVQMFRSDFQEGYNYYFWTDDDYDELITEQRRTNDREARQEMVYEAQETINQRGPSTWLMYPDNLIAWNSDKWEGVVEIRGMGSANMLSFANMEPTTDDDTLVVSIDNEIEYINPFQQSGEGDLIQNRMLWDRLVWPDGNANPSPRFARELNYVDDTTLEVPLRRGERFHDGTEILAEDVKFSFDVHRNYQTYYTGALEPVESIEITDDYRVEFRLAQVSAPFPLTGLGRIGIAPKRHWEEIIENEMEGENPMEYQEAKPIGSGPLQFDSWDQGNQTRLVRYDDHFDPVAYSERVTRLIPEVQTTLTQLETGTIDMLGLYSGDNGVLEQRVQENDDLSMTATTSVGFKQISYNNKKAPMHIDAFRRAMHHRVPKDLIVNEIYEGYGDKAPNTPVSTALEFWHNDDLEERAFDLQSAANVLADAGFLWDDGEGKLHMPADSTTA